MLHNKPKSLWDTQISDPSLFVTYDLKGLLWEEKALGHYI